MNTIEYILQLRKPRKMQVGGIVYVPKKQRNKINDLNIQLDAMINDDWQNQDSYVMLESDPESNWINLASLSEIASSTNEEPDVPIGTLMPGAKPIILQPSISSSAPAASSIQLIPQTNYKRGIVSNSGSTAYSRNDFSKSETAKKQKIDNTIPSEYHERIDLMADILNDLQNSWGSPIKLTSGFRSPELNKNIPGSSKTSVHTQGYAMDIVPVNGRMDEFIKFIKKWSKDKDFDQILIEKSKSGSRWIHFGLYNNEGKQRRQIRNINV